MNNLQVDYFLAVAQNLSFSKAAAEMYISQPAISRQIAALEKELGHTLFDRTKRRTQLTKQGELYFDFFSKFKAEFSKVAIKAKQYDHKTSNHLVVGCPSFWDTSNFMLDILQKLRLKDPHIEIQLKCYGFSELDNHVRNGMLDIIITPCCMLNAANLQVRTLTSVPFHIFYSVNHPQARLDSPRVVDFRDSKFYLPNEFKEAEKLHRTIIAQHDFEPRFQLLDFETALARVLNGMGICLTDIWMRDRLFPGFRSIPLGANSTIVIAWEKTNTNKVLDLFSNELLFYFFGNVDTG